MTRYLAKTVGLLVAMGSMLSGPMSSIASPYRAELLSVISELQGLATGTYSEDEWTGLMSRLDAVYRDALSEGDSDMAVRAKVIKARTLSEMRDQHEAALAELAEVRREFANRALPESYRGVLMEEAAIHGRTGDESAVMKVMNEYKASSLYNPEQYPILGGSGPGDPIIMVRPNAGGAESSTLAAMGVQRKRAEFSAGELFPVFEVVDSKGKTRSLSDYEGQILLVDFWIESWSSWERSLPSMIRLYDVYRKRDFAILGICLARGDAEASRAFARKRDMEWPLVFGDVDLASQLGLIGTVGNFIVDEHGLIVGRDLYGADLESLIQKLIDDR